MVEKLIKVRHLKQYVHNKQAKKDGTKSSSAQAPASSIAPKAIINYIHGSPIDDKHNFRRKRQRFFRMATVREQISPVQHIFTKGSVHLINNTITFPSTDVNWVLQSHEDTLILTLGVGGFKV